MKRILYATLLFVFATSTNAFAHTHLGSSSPEDGQVVTEELSEITLNFEGKIEQSSSFELSDSQGQSIPVEGISISDGIMTGSVSDPLENGEYLVNWSIIGADGHLMEGEYSFTVNVPESDSANEASNQTEQAEQVEQTEQQTTLEAEQNNEQATSEQVAETEDSEETSPLIPVIIIVLLVVIIGSVLVMRRKK